jgi:uncharacterized protein
VSLRCEWDEDKAARNVRKHAIAFAEASTLFTSGVDYLEIFDVEHSVEEERFICIGPIERGIVVVVTVRRGHRRDPAHFGTPRDAS